jgi:hypothetical protein
MLTAPATPSSALLLTLYTLGLLPSRRKIVLVCDKPVERDPLRVTFTQPGVYQYEWVLHDQLGIVGVIIVLP